MNLMDLKNLTDGGNTETPSVRYRRWCFTLNNWTDEEKSQLLKSFEGLRYIIGEEIGEMEETPHLQGYVEFKNQKTLSALKKINHRISWHKCNGNREQNVAYCTKEGRNIVSTFPRKRKDVLLAKYDGVVWKPWQQQVIDIVESEPDSRSIYWFWEPTGNVGKSFLTKYLFLKYDAVIATGKTADIANQLKNWLEAHEENQEFPRLAIMDVPRSSLNFINFQAMEKLKDGLIYSGKYEGGACAVDDLHLICFANEEPNLEGTISLDQWHVIRIE